MRLDMAAISSLSGEPQQDWLLVAKFGTPGTDAAVVQLDSTHWMFRSGQLKYGVDATLTVDLYLEPSNLSSEWRRALADLGSDLRTLIAQREAERDLRKQAILDREIGDKAHLRNSLVELLVENQLPVVHTAFAPVIIQDLIPPTISDLSVQGQFGEDLPDGVVSETNFIKLSWNTSDDGVAETSFSFNGVSYPITDLGDGNFTTTIDASSFAEDTLRFQITAVDFAGNRTVVTRIVKIDRLPPRLAVAGPSDCSVERLTAVQAVTGTLVEANLQLFSITQFDDHHPSGQSLAITLSNGAFSASYRLSPGDNRFEIFAVDAVGHEVRRTIHQAFFAAAQPVSYNATAIMDDSRPIDGRLAVNGAMVHIPGRIFVQGPSTFVFEPGAQDTAETFQATLDPASRYTYTASTGTLAASPDGCHRTLTIIYPSIIAVPAAQLATVDGAGNPVSGVSYEFENKPVQGSAIQVPLGISFDVAVNYGVSRGKARIEGGVHANETVLYTLSTGQIQRISSPGKNVVQFAVQPTTVQVENRSALTQALISPQTNMAALFGVDGVFPSEFDGFRQSYEFVLAAATDYEIAVHGGRFFARPADAPGLDRVSFFYDLASVPLTAVDKAGVPLTATFKTLGVSQQMSGTTPSTLQLGLSSEADVSVGLNGFVKSTHVGVFEDEVEHLDVAMDVTSRTYSFSKPGIEWVLDPVSVRFESVDAVGAPVASTVGVSGSGTPQGPSPQLIRLADHTSGKVFSSQGTSRREFVLQIQKGKIHTLNVATGSVVLAPSSNADTVVRFQY